jgi:tripartite ATP-independent transporter DctM subunit
MDLSIIIILISFAVLLILMILGMHVALAMGIVGFAGCWYFLGLKSALASLASIPYMCTTNFLLVAIPLYMLMGGFAMHAGIASEFYEAISKLIGNVRGGLAIATIAGCAAFAAISGSSLATAATLGAIAIPEMRKLGYDSKIATGCVAAGGTLGIMIPPSTLFILYGWLTEVSIGKLFIAGILPGLLTAVMYVLTILVYPIFVPKAYAPTPVISWGIRLRSTKNFIPVTLIFVLVIGGIYGGLFTPTEAAAVGMVCIFVLGLIRRKLSISKIQDAVLQAGWATAMTFTIVIGAYLLGYYLAQNKFPELLSQFVLGLGVSRWGVFLGILGVYFILGMLLDTLSMIVLTVPVMFPVAVSQGFDPIWFGVIICKLIELALVTPPVGMNIYVLAGVAPEVPLHHIFIGVFPFIISDIITLTMLVIFPQIILFLPGTM